MDRHQEISINEEGRVEGRYSTISALEDKEENGVYC
jgi:hypothetical protein